MKCKRKECHNAVTQKNMVYCSRDCSPLGNYGLDEKPSPTKYVREKSKRLPETKPEGMSEAFWKSLKR